MPNKKTITSKKANPVKKPKRVKKPEHVRILAVPGISPLKYAEGFFKRNPDGVLYISELRMHFNDMQIALFIRSRMEREKPIYKVAGPSHVQEDNISWLKRNVNSLYSPPYSPTELWYYIYYQP